MDFTRLNFWWPERHGDILEFGQKFELDCDDITARQKAYTAYQALLAIEFGINSNSKSEQTWLHDNLTNRLSH